MSKQKRTYNTGTMLDLWRPPQGSGDPMGCLATTYTFMPGLFDEQCLARFLEIESEPNREDLAFLLERESLLGGIYAGVLVDHTQAGVEHSLRWDVLPVRIRAGKQHAKVSLLSWNRHVRIIAASANLTEPGYRTNQEVAAAADLTPEKADTEMLAVVLSFLRRLILLVPGASERLPEVRRAEAFLDHVERQVQGWKPIKRGRAVRQHFLFTLPANGAGHPARSSLEDAIQICRVRGGSPIEAWVASPFFDADKDASRVTASLCKQMARGIQRELRFCVPALRGNDTVTIPRLAAPKSILLTPQMYQGIVNVDMLPEMDRDKNCRPWHAKMLALSAEKYFAIMVGSSNFTCAGMGVTTRRNVEANILTVVDRVAYSREVSQLEAVWPEVKHVDNPESAEWLGAQPENDEEEQVKTPFLPAGFLSASYRSGDSRQIILRFDPANLPEDWFIFACGQDSRDIMSAFTWREQGNSPVANVAWAPVHPPEKLLVRWADHEAFLPLNVEDSRSLPPPSQLEHMSADDMLLILAASDPSAAFRTWARKRQPPNQFDTELDAAIPIDLDPLRRYNLQITFLHRIRRRARILAQLRSNLERSVRSKQALEWRLHGLVGIEPLADRLVREFADAEGTADESLLTLADLLIVLHEVNYAGSDGFLMKAEFDSIFRPFLSELAAKLHRQVETRGDLLSEEIMRFWKRVVERCRA